MVLSALFVKEILKNVTRSHERIFASPNGKHAKIGSTASVRNRVLIISQITLRDCHVHIFATTFIEIAQLSKFTFLVINPRQLTYTASRSMLL